MSQIEVPLRSGTLWSTGDVLLWADLMLRLKDKTGAWKQEVFQVDTGTHYYRVGIPGPAA